ncbi:rhamnan synthesis F family protein [Escherichia coli]|uniref:rhamnan synthesis F family protein n=1 Tax=Escherichia coli TaxID=562 RepID=UPI0007473F60|nr:rhamnan synthesis F family protein [Escherichia coli]KUH32749.1 hypothetical protein ARC98_01550 [Escherichia coli]
MRVLIYVEPHFLRDEKTHFHTIARDFLPLLTKSAKLDVRMYANYATLDRIKDCLPPYEKYLIRPSEDDERVFARYHLDWITYGVSTWLDLMAGIGQVSKDYQQVLERIWHRFPFDVILHWGENGAVSRFIEDRCITRIAMELGCTRPPFLDSLVMDPFGTNGAGMVPKLSISELRDIVGNVPMSRQEAMLAYSQNLESKPYSQQFNPVHGTLIERLSKAGRIAFMPLQLFDDANLLRFSPYKTLSDVVLDVVPKLAAAGFTTIITPHPASKHRPRGAYTAMMARSELKEWADQVIWLELDTERPNNAQLISISDVVVTVNSSVGFEALYFDKPVVVLGDAVYKPRDLFPTLEDFLADRFDRLGYLQGIGWLRRFFLGGYLQRKNVLSEMATFEQMVGMIDLLYRSHAGDPVALAKGFWQATSVATQCYAESQAFRGKSEQGSHEFVFPLVAVSESERPMKLAISDESVQWIPAARLLLEHTGLKTIEAFTEWLRESLNHREGIEAIVTVGKILIADEYLNRYPDLSQAGVQALQHYVSHGIKEKRIPRNNLPRVDKQGLLEKISAAATLVIDSYPLDQDEFAMRNRDLSKIRSDLVESNRRIAVVAHLYYRDLVPEILEKLKGIPEAFDLIVTLPTWGNQRIEAMVRESYPEAVFYHAANRGRDIGPFVDLLPILIDKDYDAVLKIQTKRGYYVAGKMRPELGDLWREEAFDALLGDQKRITAILDAFRTQPDLTMVGPAPHYLSLEDYPYHDQGALAKVVLDEFDANGFFAGTMFWVQPSCLKPLLGKLALSITSFAPETGANDGALAHLIERLFGHAASAAGRIMSAPVDLNVPLIENPQTLNIKMHERMLQALEEKASSSNELRKRGALAW